MKPILSIILFFSMVWPVCAQKGTNAWAVEVGTSAIMMDEVLVLNPGFNDKYLHGVGRHGQLSATLGVWVFIEPQEDYAFYTPLSLGYRFNFNKLYIEPAVGGGFYSYRSIDSWFDAGSESYREGVIFSAVDIGCQWKKINAAFQAQVQTAGYAWPGVLPMLSFKLGYKLHARP